MERTRGATEHEMARANSGICFAHGECFTSVESIYLLNALLGDASSTSLGFEEKQTPIESREHVVFTPLALPPPPPSTLRLPSESPPCSLIVHTEIPPLTTRSRRHATIVPGSLSNGRASLDHPSHCATDIQTPIVHPPCCLNQPPPKTFNRRLLLETSLDKALR